MAKVHADKTTKRVITNYVIVKPQYNEIHIAFSTSLSTGEHHLFKRLRLATKFAFPFIRFLHLFNLEGSTFITPNNPEYLWWHLSKIISYQNNRHR